MTDDREPIATASANDQQSATAHTRRHGHRVRPRKRQSSIKSHKDILPVLRISLREWQQPMLKKLEDVTGMDRVKLFYVFCAFVICWLVMGPGNQFLCNLIGIVYPAYQSVLAVRTQTKDDDTQWLIYWCSFALFILFDFVVNTLLISNMIPLYLLLKTAALLYLALPQTYGAHNVYVSYVDPLVDWIDENGTKLYRAETTAQ